MGRTFHDFPEFWTNSLKFDSQKIFFCKKSRKFIPREMNFKGEFDEN